MAASVSPKSPALRVTGKQWPSEYFQILEREKFDPRDVVRVMRGEVAGVIFRGAIEPEACERVKKNFWASPMLRQRGDAVPAYYLGTYHYQKELELYLNEAAATHAALDEVFAGTRNFYREIMGGIAAVLKKDGVTLRVAEHGGRAGGEFVMRSW
ncbi:MAG TPA: hypothetical protein VHV47_03995, partial [Opitutaceae bacterium]|nr:hypothetical protein [Opitutaceae bacterium]